ncbi:MAG: FecR domain-containing protein [Verrucomicrobia subdivision 3 bacterium]|nr:FecR domain-containing protein [Limisphaerales bacterium]
MKLTFPSREFDDAAAAVCHDAASDEQVRALNDLLRSDAAARDEYILRLELHSRLASEPDLFALTNENEAALGANILPPQARPRAAARKLTWVVALAACVAILAVGWWGLRPTPPTERQGTTSKAIAMLDRAVDAQWNPSGEAPRLGAPLEPGWLRLNSGLAQIVFYSGARVVIEGPTEFQLISPSEASCRSGRLTADVPPQARGFRIRTRQMNVTDVGTVFGLDVRERRTELHVFKGNVDFEPVDGAAKQNLQEGSAVVAENSDPLRLIAADRTAFASLFNLQAKSVAADSRRCNQWRAASVRLSRDPSLLVHFAFERETDWQLPNTSSHASALADGAIVGCQWIEGRWSDKRALGFRNVNDRVRLSVPGEFEALTVAAWVRVQGLDRKLNSLFMSDGFEPGTIHWLIRNDGVLGLTVIGHETNQYQICASKPVLTLDQFGMWLHVAVVLDGTAKRVVHYVNGVPVGEKALKIKPPFRIGTAELGNWNAKGFPREDPFMIRNFSGAMDEFHLFNRALKGDEIRALYSSGKPQPDPLIQTRN